LSIQAIAQLEKQFKLWVSPKEYIYQTLGQLAHHYEYVVTLLADQEKNVLIASVPSPFYFKSNDKQLFGCYHSPRREMNKSTAILLCYPIGQEYIRSHRSYQILATTLSRSGYPVLRFDYHGCGDSEGDFEQASLAQWLKDVEVAVSALKSYSDLNQVCVIGTRIGASIAMLHAQKNEVNAMVLWDAVINGKNYLQELNRMQNTYQQQIHSKPKYQLLKGYQEYLGYLYSLNLMDELDSFDFQNLSDWHVNHLLLLQSNKENDILSLENHLSNSNKEYEHQLHDVPFVWREEPGAGLVPFSLLQSLMTWIEEVSASEKCI